MAPTQEGRHSNREEAAAPVTSIPDFARQLKKNPARAAAGPDMDVTAVAVAVAGGPSSRRREREEPHCELRSHQPAPSPPAEGEVPLALRDPAILFVVVAGERGSPRW